MRIIILGAGKVGSTLTEHLAKEEHDIVVVDTDPKRLKKLQDRLDIRTFVGHAAYPAVLRAAGAKNADMIIAVTDGDEINMVACQVAYSLFNTPMKIARVRSQHYLIRKELFGNENLPIDVFISPEQLVIDYIAALINHPGAFKVINFAGGRVKLMGVKPFYGGQLLGKRLDKIQEILPNIEMKITGIFRNKKPMPLNDETTIEVEDEVYFIAGSEYAETILGSLRPHNKSNQRVMIAGGGNIGSGLASVLEYDYQVKIIDFSQEQCQLISEKLENTTILFGDATDEELLVSENVEDMDVFCALTDSDEVNVIACMQAKRLGVKQTMALITKSTYMELIKGKDISIVISPQLATASSILTHIRGGDIISAHSLREGATEVIEVFIQGGEKPSPIIGKCIDEINIPPETGVGVILRKDDIIIPQGDTVIEEEDQIVIFIANKKHIQKVSDLFCV